jgi:predicted nucleotidyltransferase
MSSGSPTLATAIYRYVAKVSTKMLTASADVESILLHRSAATGEVSFGRSDIDLIIVITEEAAETGARMAALLEMVRRARRFNPALTHIDVCDRRSLSSHSAEDTFRASLERRTVRLLHGRPVAIPDLPVDPDHGLAKFLVWIEVFFPASVQRKSRRNIRKIALECWNAYASAVGSDHPPSLLRSEMEARARETEPRLDPDRLEDPAYASRFVFGLAQRLHDARLPALRKLPRPLIVDTVLAPLCTPRRLVVLPHAESDLPSDVYRPGAFPCTAEILDLFVHAKNAFYYWSLPQALLDLGVEPPSLTEFGKTCRYYSHERFLLAPGFLVDGPSTQAARLALVARAIDGLLRGEPPKPVSQAEMRELMPDAPTALDYYQTRYTALRRETRRLADALPVLPGASS